jgi:DNA topoisomerase-1
VVAVIVRLLDTTGIRIGNDEYARENGSFGLTTIRDRHANVNGSRIEFRFRGKGGKMQRVGVTDRRLARVVKRCQDLPGQHLFQYLDDDGAPTDVDSQDVNDYLREAGGGDFTAKDFRTWAGTVLAARELEELGRFGSPAEGQRQILRAVESAAAELGNTPAICRRCYVHPHVFVVHLDGGLHAALDRRPRIRRRGLTAHEAAVLALLERGAEPG